MRQTHYDRHQHRQEPLTWCCAVEGMQIDDVAFFCFLFSRMIHWAGRIEKELEKVLQHVTGTQQMRSVS